MPKKKSAKKSADRFLTNCKKIDAFVYEIKIKGLSDNHLSWAFEYAIVRLYRDFEKLILECLVAAINNDTTQLSQKKGFDFPKHLTDEVCQYIIVGEKYFDFRGRSGLISTLKSYLADDHYLVVSVKKPAYREALDQFIVLRNFAAHDSDQSKAACLKALGKARISSAGSYLKVNNRFQALSSKLQKLTCEIRDSAPY
ncbi:hypothetical protein [Maritimibacter sp. HL-12]|uniref:hypothetical protein n=1 Tax=Maritimibacter sp. HL-12 TaxID=1162418 RepID=UPI000A0EF07A|nr:hypothetical protein [Maritimibacter sp. HL-12]SMH52680.1 hypothetical protein SAMN05661107_2637 [Maritimibacter sp. HL-12]